jgi:hypothetical protein
MLESFIARNTGAVQLSERPRSNKASLDYGKSISSPYESLLLKVANEVSQRGRIKLTAWQTLVAYYLPRRWKSERSNKILDLARQN